MNSDLAAFASRNQVAVTGVLGLGGAALAYILNGWRDRAERRHVVEGAEKRDGAVLAREAREIAVACTTAVQALSDRSASATTIAVALREAIAPTDHLLLAASASDLARLGAGASTAARAARANVRRLEDALVAPLADETNRGRSLSVIASETAAAVLSAARIFDVLATSGPAAADRLRLMPATSISPPLDAADTANVHRLHPAN